MMSSSRKTPRLEPSFTSVDSGLQARRELAKRLIDTAKPTVVEGVILLLTEIHRERLIRNLYQAEAKK